MKFTDKIRSLHIKFQKIYLNRDIKQKQKKTIYNAHAFQDNKSILKPDYTGGRMKSLDGCIFLTGSKRVKALP